MKEFKNVRGSQVTVPRLEVNVDTVYVRSNIKPIEEENFKGWEYDEIQYTLREYQTSLGVKSENFEQDIDNVAQMVVVSLDDLQALADTLVYALNEIELLKGGIQ